MTKEENVIGFNGISKDYSDLTPEKGEYYSIILDGRQLEGKVHKLGSAGSFELLPWVGWGPTGRKIYQTERPRVIYPTHMNIQGYTPISEEEFEEYRDGEYREGINFGRYLGKWLLLGGEEGSVLYAKLAEIGHTTAILNPTIRVILRKNDYEFRLTEGPNTAVLPDLKDNLGTPENPMSNERLEGLAERLRVAPLKQIREPREYYMVFPREEPEQQPEDIKDIIIKYFLERSEIES